MGGHKDHTKTDHKCFTITSLDSEKCTTQVTLGDIKTKALIDTGANISVMNINFLSNTTYADKALSPSHVKQVLAANGNHVKVLGKIC